MGSPVVGMFIGLGMVLFAIATDVVPADWILAMVGGATFGSCLVQTIREATK